MATKSKAARSISVNAIFANAGEQFKNLNPKEPWRWPPLPQALTFLAVALVVVAVSWFTVLGGANDELNAERSREPSLKKDYRDKLAQAVNLAELRKQKEQVQEYVTQLEKQLPGKADMDALLSDINQAGLGRGLQFELFKPGQVQIKDYYAELPISIKVAGRYNDIGAFTADIANLSRIVTLHNLSIAQPGAKDPAGLLSMEATARTYRYLDANEIAEVRKAAAAKKPGAKGGKKASGDKAEAKK
jgi:type IV pilus assembly protein PilO